MSKKKQLDFELLFLGMYNLFMCIFFLIGHFICDSDVMFYSSVFALIMYLFFRSIIIIRVGE